MKTIRSVIVLITLLLIYSNCVSQSSNRLARKAEIGLYLKYLTVEEDRSVFRADFYYWITTERIDDLSIDAYKDSLTLLELINAVEIIDESVIESKWIKKADNKTYYYKQGLIHGTFSYKADYRKYPKDVQDIAIIIESPLLTSSEFEFSCEPDSSNLSSCAVYIDPNIEILGKDIDGIAIKSAVNRYKTDFGDNAVGKKDYARFRVSFFIKRDYTSFLLKILIPNILLLIIAYLVFFIPAKELEVAVGCTVTSLLSSIALKWTIDSSMPNIGYTTSTDKIFYLFYSLITFALVETVVTYTLSKKGYDKLEIKIDYLARFIYPLALFVGLFLILF